jgi:hypothetical protein
VRTGQAVIFMLWRVKEVQRFVPHFLHSPYSTGDFDIRKSAIWIFNLGSPMQPAA